MDTLQETHDEIDPLDRTFAPGWASEPGDKVRGTLVSVDKRTSEFGTYPIYTLQITDGYSARSKSGELVTGEIAVHANRDVLRRKLANADIAIGDEIGAKYQGPPLGTARSHRYRVIKASTASAFPRGAASRSTICGTRSARLRRRCGRCTMSRRSWGTPTSKRPCATRITFQSSTQRRS